MTLFQVAAGVWVDLQLLDHALGQHAAGSARLRHAGWRAGPVSTQVAAGFALPAGRPPATATPS